MNATKTSIADAYEMYMARILQKEKDPDMDLAKKRVLTYLLSRYYQWRLPRIMVVDELTGLPKAYVKIADNVLWLDVPLVNDSRGQFYCFDFDVLTEEPFDYLQFDPYQDYLSVPREWLLSEDVAAILGFVNQFPAGDSDQIILPPGYGVFRFEHKTGKKEDMFINYWHTFEDYALADFGQFEVNFTLNLNQTYLPYHPLVRSVRFFDGNKWRRLPIVNPQTGEKVKVYDHRYLKRGSLRPFVFQLNSR
jgi:hypothetical protein